MVSRVERYKSSFIQRGLQVPTAEKLANVAETTALRRGRTDTVDSIFNPSQPSSVQSPPPANIPYMPHIEPSLPSPVLPLLQCATDEILSGGSCMKKPSTQAFIPEPYSPSPFVATPPPPPPPRPVVTIEDGTQFFSQTDFKKAEKIFSPCGSYAPYATERTGQMRSFCTYADFLAAGYKQPTPVAPSTRGKLCPSGLTYWGGRCLKITYADIIGAY